MKGYTSIYNLIHNTTGEVVPFSATIEQLIHVFNTDRNHIFCITKSTLKDHVITYSEAILRVISENMEYRPTGKSGMLKESVYIPSRDFELVETPDGVLLTYINEKTTVEMEHSECLKEINAIAEIINKFTDAVYHGRRNEILLRNKNNRFEFTKYTLDDTRIIIREFKAK